jgi:hypothetical protein
MEEGIPSTDSVEREVYLRNETYRERREAEVINKEENAGQTWETLKRTTLKVGGVTIKNPYSSRIYFSRPDVNEWVKDFRKECKSTSD